MNKSEVFEEYIKIMNNGLNKTAQRANVEPKKKDIEKMYRNEEDVIKYNKNLMQEAHPKKVIFGPAYDPVNALVENNIERHNIMTAIVNKNPTGQLDHKKYAEQQLKLSLIKIANELDFKDSRLRPLADTCIDQFNKQAAGPAALVVGGLAALIGIIYAQQHFPNAQQPLDLNYKDLIQSIDEIRESDSNFIGFGEEYTDDFKQTLDELRRKTNAAYYKCSEISKVIAKFDKPRTPEEAIEFAKSEEVKKLEPMINHFISIRSKIVPYYESASKKFKDEQFQLRQVKEKGALTGLIDKIPGLHGGWGLFTNKLDVLSERIEAFSKSIKGYADAIDGALKQKDKAEADLKASTSSTPESPTELGQTPGLDKQVSPDAPKEEKSLPKRNKTDEEILRILNM